MANGGKARRSYDITATSINRPPAGGKRRKIREGGSASRVSINARPQDLDSWPMEAKVKSKNLEGKPMKILVISCKLDSQPMVGTTYLERPAPAVYLDQV